MLVSRFCFCWHTMDGWCEIFIQVIFQIFFVEIVMRNWRSWKWEEEVLAVGVRRKKMKMKLIMIQQTKVNADIMNGENMDNLLLFQGPMRRDHALMFFVCYCWWYFAWFGLELPSTPSARGTPSNWSTRATRKEKSVADPEPPLQTNPTFSSLTSPAASRSLQPSEAVPRPRFVSC